MTFDQFIKEKLETGKVYDSVEVEKLMQEAWVEALKFAQEIIMYRKLRFDAQMDQEHARVLDTDKKVEQLWDEQIDAVKPNPLTGTQEDK